MTFGMFQWTAGAGSNPGELPPLLRRIKEADENVFQEYTGQHGLDIVQAVEKYPLKRQASADEVDFFYDL